MNDTQEASLNEGDALVVLNDTGVMMNGSAWFRTSFSGGQRDDQWGGILCAIGQPIYGVIETCTSPIANGSRQQ